MREQWGLSPETVASTQMSFSLARFFISSIMGDFSWRSIFLPHYGSAGKRVQCPFPLLERFPSVTLTKAFASRKEEDCVKDRVRLGISACLLGQNVRYDGGHKLDRYLTDTLGQYVEYVPVCPEAECGLGIPREAMRLVGDPRSPRLVTVRSGKDHTERMLNWARGRVRELEK